MTEKLLEEIQAARDAQGTDIDANRDTGALYLVNSAQTELSSWWTGQDGSPVAPDRNHLVRAAALLVASLEVIDSYKEEVSDAGAQADTAG